MCMGYAREIRAWVCDDTHIQRDEMLQAWSMAFIELIDAPVAPVSLLPIKSVPALEELAVR